uniref:Uncharacterized protein n=1 Tax=Chromera velia CCMP2878 TaxID=1169474 RepID=A0A0G4HTX1_9ALVE|eukprot:Cvel_31606.t1-p1 / transcript=Cvel_31606.t1 / gene=Cvel_31606 / organism=Chromera_velia_CCMP2878 / gene_product=hypothetical protein / transcript_product=hypothetical protein / location=Cvel_scaffold4743:1080-1325(+) / protein_length=82 / sequence_SO=supercontig / SO=protein_coding / is_pseudo=false
MEKCLTEIEKNFHANPRRQPPNILCALRAAFHCHRLQPPLCCHLLPHIPGLPSRPCLHAEWEKSGQPKAGKQINWTRSEKRK